MKKIIMASLVIICAVTIMVSFFMPWAKANVSVTKVAQGLQESAVGPLKDTPFAGKFISKLSLFTENVGKLGNVEIKTAVSGYDIPTLLNKKSSNIALSLAQVFTKDAENLDKKSLLVYLLPLLAIVCIVFALLGLKNKLFIIAAGMIGAVVSLPGLYKVMTTTLSNNVVQISIERGLWQTLYGYLLILVLSIIWLVIDR